LKISIQNGLEYTNNKNVTLKIDGHSGITQMGISNKSDLSDALLENYQTEKQWNLCQSISSLDCRDGAHTVYVKFYANYGQTSEVISDDIILDTSSPQIRLVNIKDSYNESKDVILSIATEANAEIILHWNQKYGLVHSDNQGNKTINLGKMPVGNYKLEMVPTDLALNKGEPFILNLSIKPKEEFPINEENIVIDNNQGDSLIDKFIPDFLKEEPVEEEPEEMIIISEEAPLSMNGNWDLLSKDSLRTFVLAPLPADILRLAAKFPELQETLKKVGINKITDIEKLVNANLILPGLTERSDLPNTEIVSGKLVLPDGVPLALLTREAKKQIPSEIIFAKTGGELIDFNMALSINDQGQAQQKITTIVGKPLQLVVKPDSPVKSVKGYVVLKSIAKEESSSAFSLRDIIPSKLFASPILAYPQQKPVKVENKLVLLEFEYTDTDGDGLYTANIESSLVEGEYEIITVLEFEDPTMGKREIRLITVVDPEGYIYTNSTLGKVRIADASSSIYWFNPLTKEYELWKAEEYQQKNPQITDDTGKYSFLVPPGKYYLKIEHSDYYPHQSEIFEVKEGSGVHMNIELKVKGGWFKMIDWKILLIIIFGILLFYIFYRDKIRERLFKKILENKLKVSNKTNQNNE
jgi:hypothetical protein